MNTEITAVSHCSIFPWQNRLDACIPLVIEIPLTPPSIRINECLLKLGCYGKIAMKGFNGLFDRLQNCFGTNGKDRQNFFLFQMVLMWFDLSTRGSSCYQALHRKSVLLVVFNGSKQGAHM